MPLFLLNRQRSVGVLSRENLANSLPINGGSGNRLQILVENQGRINFKIANDTKGIIGDALFNNQPLGNWTITGFPFDDAGKFALLVADEESPARATNQSNVAEPPTVIGESSIVGADGQATEPVILHGTFALDETQIFDTFISTEGWGKVYKCKMALFRLSSDA